MGGEKRAPWRSLTSLRRGLDAMFSQNIGDGALGPVANTDTKLLIYGLFQKGRVLAQDGELDHILYRINADNGSSPRVRGTHFHLRRHVAPTRFIPARAGNSSQNLAAPAHYSVHPRACGELFCWLRGGYPHYGSSPRVRGTP